MSWYSPKWISTLGVVGCLVFATYLYWEHPTPAGPHSLSLGHYITALPSSASTQVKEQSDLWPYRVFQSSPWTPPNISIAYRGGDLAKGDLLITPKSRNGDEIRQSAPFIISSDNDLVYGFNSSHGVNDLRVQTINGSPHLTFFHGESVLGHGYGELILLDQEYRQSTIDLSEMGKLIRPRLPKRKHAPGKADFHELEITERDTALITAYNNIPFDLTSIGGSNESWVVDSMFFEVEIATGEILFNWSALDHVPINSSHLPLHSYMGNGSSKKPYDFFHINSIQDLEAGYLVNSRHMWATYLISKEDGHVIWELSGSGEGGDFGPTPAEGQFRWQHHGRAHNVTESGLDVSLFDNHNMEDDNGTLATRGLVLHLDLPPDANKAPTVLRNLHTSDEHYAGSQGSYDPDLENSNQLIGYGPIPVIREFGPASRGSPLLWEGRFGHDEHAQNYRAFKSSWHGTPRDWNPVLVVEKPDVISDDESSKITFQAYVSWNGATDIERWNVYVSADEKDWRMLGWANKHGFETKFRAESSRRCMRIAAVRRGKEIRNSNAACLDLSERQ